MKRKILTVALVMLSVFTFSACGKSDKGTETADGKVPLRVAIWKQNDEEFYREIEKRFEEKYDNIDVQFEINGDESSYNTNLQADMMDGSIADVFDLHANTTMASYAKTGLLASQQDMDYMANYDESAKAVSTMYGENYGFINAYSYFGFIYNIDIFNELGIKVPTTPEELVTAVKTLQDAGYGGIAYPGLTNGNAIFTAAFVSAIGSDNFKNFYEGIDNGTIKDISTENGIVDVLKTIQTYTQEDIWYNAFDAMSYEPSLSLFATEKTAIAYVGTYIFGEKDLYFPNVNAGYFPIPTYAANGVSYAEGGQCTCIRSDTEYLEEAKLWVEFLASPEISEYYCSNAKVFSTITGVEPEFDTAEMIMSSSTGYALSPVLMTENTEWWSHEWSLMIEGILWEGKDYQALMEDLNAQLVEADIANRQ